MSSPAHNKSWRGGPRQAKGLAFALDVVEISNTPLGPCIAFIDGRSLLIEDDAPTIEDVEYVASYSWRNGESPAILVPGSPPAWTPIEKPLKLRPDHEDVFRDINAARHPSYPMETAIRAVFAMQLDFDMQSIDVVGCGSTFGNLLMFAGSISRPFRFDVDVVNDTVYFIRRGKSATEVITGLRGYGHTFPEAYTTWDMEVRDSRSHQRLIKYTFGGLQLMIRTETDGYIKRPAQARSNSNSTSDATLEDNLEIMSIGLGDTSGSANGQIDLKMAGKKVSQDQIFDIKTRWIGNALNMNEIYPRLWVNQTHNFLLAYNDNGVFDNPQMKNIREDVLKWEKDRSALLARYQATIQRIIDVARASDIQQLEVAWDGEGPLSVNKQLGDRRRVLPPELLSQLD